MYFPATFLCDTTFKMPVQTQEYVSLLNYLSQTTMYMIIIGTSTQLV